MTSQDSQEAEPSTLNTLLPNPSVTILIDGLICTAYDEEKRLYQAGIHTDAIGHHMIVEVRIDGNPELLFPTAELPWDSSHEAIIKNEPFRLYVESESQELQRASGVNLYEPNNPRSPLSFANILSFEDLYQRSLKLDADRIAEFNVLDGTSYSARNSGADLMQFDQGSDPGNAEFVRRINVSTMGAIDIAPIRDGEGQKWIVLENKAGRFFRFLLQPKRHYQIKLMNVPIDHTGGGDPKKHFLQFYKLFKLNSNEKVFLIKPDERSPFKHPDFPPCNQTRRSQNCGLWCP